MSQDHTLMESRYELKYLIPNTLALQVRDFVQQHLEIDEFGACQPNLSYPVHSVYLDTDDWKIYARSLNGDKNRFKLRVRYYNDSPSTPVFFEIKRRMKDVILKQRCGVFRGGEEAVLAGHLPAAKYLASTHSAERFSLERFIELMMTLNAKPKLHVAYEREAYVSPFNNEVRLTMDRFVRAVPRFGGQLITAMDKPLQCTTNTVVLELKFSGRFPNWYRELVRTFECFQTGAAKYVESTILYLNRDLPERDIPRNLCG
jgi:hypothetical protein